MFSPLFFKVCLFLLTCCSQRIDLSDIDRLCTPIHDANWFLPYCVSVCSLTPRVGTASITKIWTFKIYLYGKNKNLFIQTYCLLSSQFLLKYWSLGMIKLVVFQFPLVLLPEGINFLSQSIMCHLPEDNVPLTRGYLSPFPLG